MRLKHNSATTIRASNTTLIHEAACSRRRSAHLDLILIAFGRQASIIPAARAMAKEQVIITTVMEYESALDGRRRRVVRELVRGDAARERQRRGLHLRLVDVLPERAPRQVVRAADVDEVRVDGVVRLRRVRLHSRGPVVRPRPHVH